MISVLNSYFANFKFHKESDTSRVTLWAVILTLLALFLIGANSYWTYQKYQSVLKNQIELHMNSLVIDRELMTRMIIDKHKAELQLLAQNEKVKSFFLSSASNIGLVTDLLNNNPAYSGWVLTDETNSHRLTGGIFPLEYQRRMLQQSAKSPDGYSFILDHSEKGDRVYLIAQKIRSRGLNIGTLMVADRFRMLDDLYNDKRALGMSGESFISDNKGRALTALRYPYPVDHAMSTEAMVSCLSGKEQTFMFSPDYADVSTAMAFRQVKGYGGCIMVHMRADEVLAPIVTMRNIALQTSAVIFLFVIVMARVVARMLIRNINERNAAEKVLRIASTALETHDAIMITDATANIIKVNKSFTRISGYSEEDVLGKNPRILSSGRHNKVFFANIFKKLQRDGSWIGEIWDRCKNGEICPRSMTISAVKDKHNQLTNYVAIFNDISDNKKNEELINKMAFYDALTQLANRRLLDDRMEQAIAACKRSELFGVVLFLDLDNFKPLNDTHGHKAGDLLLVEVAHRLSKCVREVDTVARFGGDEFVVVLCELGMDETGCIEQARIVAEKIRTALSEPYWIASNSSGSTKMIVQKNIGVSIGVALFNHGSSAEKILKYADKAMYEAKESGRNAIRFYKHPN